MLGIHVIGSVRPFYESLKRWQPRCITVLNPDNGEFRDLREICPQTFLHARYYLDDNDVRGRIESNPKDAAKYFHELIQSKQNPYMDAAQVINEVCQTDTLDKLIETCLYQIEYANGAGYKCSLPAFSVTNPWQNLLTKCYPLFEACEKYQHYVCAHSYNTGRSVYSDRNAETIENWELRILPNIPYKRFKLIMAEYGNDKLLFGVSNRPSGYKDGYDGDYVNDLINITNSHYNLSDRIVGYCIFSAGVSSPWESYCIDGEMNRFADYYSQNPQRKDNIRYSKDDNVTVTTELTKGQQLKATDILNFRDAPNGNVLFQLQKDEVVVYIDKSNEWLNVYSFNHNIAGYVHKDYVS